MLDIRMIPTSDDSKRKIGEKMEERKRKAGKKKRLGMTLATCGAAEDKAAAAAAVVVVIASININHASNLACQNAPMQE